MSGTGWKSARIASLAIVASVVWIAVGARAEEPTEAVPSADEAAPSADEAAPSADEAAPSADVAPATPEVEAAAPARPRPFTIGGYVETYYQWNFNRPSNGITNYRGFDNRHNTFTIANVALDTSWDYKNLVGRLTLQVGSTPSTYYLSEPSHPGSTGANASSAELWKYIQQAYAGYRIPVGGGLTITAGIFLSPIGPETMAVHDNWNWSRANTFFGLPFYHTGVRAAYAVNDALTVEVAVFNGWNSVVDNNQAKSLVAHVTYAKNAFSLSALYFTGIERPTGSPEGAPWRHLFDAYASWNATRRLTLVAHANGGFEPNDYGTSHWVAGALYARVAVHRTLFVALRGDAFSEHVPSNASGSAKPIFWPAPWVSSATATLDYRPHPHVSVRLEFRHDQAGAPMYFGGEVMGNGTTMPYVMNRSAQNTVTIGATTWL